MNGTNSPSQSQRSLKQQRRRGAVVPEPAWQIARQSRDPRWDGRFFVGVISTGIFCRPICPARPPLEKNVAYFSGAPGALAAGFRPCKRCRPESAPGSGAWIGTGATVRRALRHLDEGALEEHGSVAKLAAKLGVGDRHLRRLFLRHLGAAPRDVAKFRRLLFARRLIEETRLPLADIAFASGFGSVRRFNDAFAKAYQAAPKTFRRPKSPVVREPKSRQSSSAAGVLAGGSRRETLSLRLPLRSPYDFDHLLGFLAPRAIPGVEEVDRGAYRRAVASDGLRALLTVRFEEKVSSLSVQFDVVSRGARLPALLPLVERVRHLFDLDADPEAVSRILGSDSQLAPLLERWPGTRVPGAWDSWEVMVRAVLGQQVSVAGATTLAGRLVSRFGAPLLDSTPGSAAPTDPSQWCLFPEARRLVSAPVEEIGLPRQRAETLRSLARLSVEGLLEPGLEPDLLVRRLLATKGIGPWTANYIAMRAFRWSDAFPSGDLWLRRAFGRAAPLTEKQLERRSEAWRPWRSYAAMWLWRSAGAQQAAAEKRAVKKPVAGKPGAAKPSSEKRDDEKPGKPRRGRSGVPRETADRGKRSMPRPKSIKQQVKTKGKR